MTYTEPLHKRKRIFLADSSLLVNGLDAVLDRCNADEAWKFLRLQAKLLITTSQRHWTHIGLVFLFPVDDRSTHLDIDERLVHTLPNGETVVLSQAL